MSRSYFDTMRNPRSSNRTYALGVTLALFVLYFIYSINTTSSLSATSLLRQRISAAAAANPLSPPTSAFRKQPSSPNAPRQPPPVVHYDLNTLTSSPSLSNNTEKILILTPLARFYDQYWSNLLSLSYPHEHISLGFITPKTKEGDAATKALQQAIDTTQHGPEAQRFQSITILRQDFEPPLTTQSEGSRHEMRIQRERRGAMARARNSLLFTTIGPHTSWVLWLDGDIIETPPTLIQDLIAFDKPIIVPNCFQRYVTDAGDWSIRPYDYNSWQDSDTALDLARTMEPDDILLEGYAEMPTYRTLMAMLYDNSIPEAEQDKKKVMDLDGVGGTALMVKAEVHRDGAMFPPFSFYHLIETEGFAKMARRLGYRSYGAVGYLVFHYNE